MKTKDFSVNTLFGERCKEMKEYLENFVYGKIPEKAEHLRADLIREDSAFAGGEGIARYFSIICTVGGAEIAFRAKLVSPAGDRKSPVFINLYYSDDNPDRALPVEEMVDKGYAVMTLCAMDIAKIDGDKRSALERRLCPSRKRGNAPGKLALYAWALMRTADFALSLPYIDDCRVIALGQGVMARATLLSAAFDERFSYVAVCGHQFNHTNSMHIKEGLYCPRFDGISSCNDELLYSLCAPRHIMVCNTSESYFTDREKEFEHLLSLNEIYTANGMGGLSESEVLPSVPSDISGDGILYRYRGGSDFLCRKDMLSFMNYIEKCAKSKL